MKCLPILKLIFEKQTVIEKNGRRSLNELINQIVTQIINSYDKYMNKLNEAAIVRSLLQNSLNILGLEENSDIVYERKIDPNEAKKMRYKITIDNIKLTRKSQEGCMINPQEIQNKVYSADIFFQQRHIVETDLVAPHRNQPDIEFETSFEIDTNLFCGYLEFRIFNTLCDDRNQMNFLSKKNMTELINFNENESNDNIYDNRNADNLPYQMRSSNPFETMKKTKSANDIVTHSKQLDLNKNISMPSRHGALNYSMFPKSASPSKIFPVNNEDIKIEIKNESCQNLDVPKTPTNFTNLVPGAKASSILGMVRSPIKEENEEDEASHQDTPSQSTSKNKTSPEIKKEEMKANTNLSTYQPNEKNDPDIQVPKFELNEAENDDIFERGYDSFKEDDFQHYK